MPGVHCHGAIAKNPGGVKIAIDLVPMVALARHNRYDRHKETLSCHTQWAMYIQTRRGMRRIMEQAPEIKISLPHCHQGYPQ